MFSIQGGKQEEKRQRKMGTVDWQAEKWAARTRRTQSMCDGLVEAWTGLLVPFK